MGITFVRHPERKGSEVFLLNCTEERWATIHWRSKRRGEVAYDEQGHPITGQFPVFVDISDLLEREIKVTLPEGPEKQGSVTIWSL
jgi:hypothetical protein